MAKKKKYLVTGTRRIEFYPGNPINAGFGVTVKAKSHKAAERKVRKFLDMFLSEKRESIIEIGVKEVIKRKGEKKRNGR